MGPSKTPDSFYLYLWRSPNLPGTLYLAKGFATAEALCHGLTEDGYIVRVIQASTDIEFEFREGKLYPSFRADAALLEERSASSSRGVSPVLR